VKLFRALFYLLLFGVSAGLGGLAWFEFMPPAKTCLACHEIQPSAAEWAHGAHSNVNCKACHGGTVESAAAFRDNLRRAWRHVSVKGAAPRGLSSEQVDRMSAACARCHRAAGDQWARSGHASPLSRFLEDARHNSAWSPADQCLRCHGMFLEGDVGTVLERVCLPDRYATAADLPRVWRIRSRRAAEFAAVPCLACHRMHGGDPYMFYSRADSAHFPYTALHSQKIVSEAGPVRAPADPRSRMCRQCHAANAFGAAGSSDDRAPRGAHEGVGCLECHRGHDRRGTRRTCGSCHAKCVWPDGVRNPIHNPHGVLENGKLKVVLNVSDGSFDVSDKRTGRLWRSIVDGSNVFSHVWALSGDGVTSLSFRATSVRQGKRAGDELHVDLFLEGDALSVRVEAPTNAAPLAYPYPLESRADDRNLLAFGPGFAFPAGETDLGPGFPERMRLGSQEFNLPAWGVYAEKTIPEGEVVPCDGYLAEVAGQDGAWGRYSKRGNGRMQFSIEWEAGGGAPREVRYTFFVKGGPVAFADRLRAQLKRRGLVSTLAEKAARRPELKDAYTRLARSPAVLYAAIGGDKPGVCRTLREECGMRDFVFAFAAREELKTWVTDDERAACAAAVQGAFFAQCGGVSWDSFALLDATNALAAASGAAAECAPADFMPGSFSAPSVWRAKGVGPWEVRDGDPPAEVLRGLDPAVRVPFRELTLHGAVLSASAWDDANNKFPKVWWKRDLFNAACGSLPTYVFTRETWPRFRRDLAESVKRSVTVAAATANARFVAYRFLTPDRMVQRSEFDNGVACTVNFGGQAFRLPNGKVVPPRTAIVE
jgi:hypothetical protein